MHSQKVLKINQFEDIDLMMRRHSLIRCELVPDLYESVNKYKGGIKLDMKFK